VLAVGDTDIDAPVVESAAVVVSVYHFQTALVPSVPPVSVSVLEPPEQTLDGEALTVEATEDAEFTVSFAPELVTGLPPPVEVTRQEYVSASPDATALMDNEFVVVPVKCPSVKLPAAFFH
jgi:hypothetical protein